MERDDIVVLGALLIWLVSAGIIGHLIWGRG